jgi:hypothetical protein
LCHIMVQNLKDGQIIGKKKCPKLGIYIDIFIHEYEHTNINTYIHYSKYMKLHIIRRLLLLVNMPRKLPKDPPKNKKTIWYYIGYTVLR